MKIYNKKNPSKNLVLRDHLEAPQRHPIPRILNSRDEKSHSEHPVKKKRRTRWWSEGSKRSDVRRAKERGWHSRWGPRLGPRSAPFSQLAAENERETTQAAHANPSFFFFRSSRFIRLPSPPPAPKSVFIRIHREEARAKVTAFQEVLRATHVLLEEFDR